MKFQGHGEDDDDEFKDEEADQNRINAELENEMSGLSSDDDDDFEARFAFLNFQLRTYWINTSVRINYFCITCMALGHLYIISYSISTFILYMINVSKSITVLTIKVVRCYTLSVFQTNMWERQKCSLKSVRICQSDKLTDTCI